MDPIKSVLEFNEHDRDQGVTRTYMYYTHTSHHLITEKQEVDLLDTATWGQMLFLDGVLQSTSKDEIIYHTALVHPLMNALSNRESILLLGGGEGATAREVLRWEGVGRVDMVEYDRELVSFMKSYGSSWSRGAFRDRRLTVVYDDAWAFMESCECYDGIIVDLTDPNLNTEDWDSLLKAVMRSVQPLEGGFVMNAGFYLPWKTGALRQLKGLIEGLCTENPGYMYTIYTAMVPSFGGEWTFIAVTHKKKFITEPEFMTCIPTWIRRLIRPLANPLIDYSAETMASQGRIRSNV